MPVYMQYTISFLHYNRRQGYVVVGTTVFLKNLSEIYMNYPIIELKPV